MPLAFVEVDVLRMRMRMAFVTTSMTASGCSMFVAFAMAWAPFTTADAQTFLKVIAIVMATSWTIAAFVEVKTNARAKKTSTLMAFAMTSTIALAVLTPVASAMAMRHAI
jgi:hypothetical protein